MNMLVIYRALFDCVSVLGNNLICRDWWIKMRLLQLLMLDQYFSCILVLQS